VIDPRPFRAVLAAVEADVRGAQTRLELEPEDIAMLRTRSKTGAMVPLGSLTTFPNRFRA
jgi:hypothetical protein